jgi:uncharacterized protein (DUF2147 family)
MRKLVLIAAMLMASASAHAGSFSFNVEGQKVRVNIPRGCSSLSCINVSAPGLADKFKDKGDTSSTSTTTTTATAPAAAPAPAPAPQVAATTPAAPVAPAPAAEPQTSPKVSVLPAPTDTNSTTATAPTVSAPEAQPAPVAAPAPAPVQVAAAPSAPAAPAPTPPAVQTASSPLGIWMSEKKEGKIRIEDCNGNLCGYAVNKDGSNGAKVLINMKPRGDKWAGRINDTRSGGTYDSTIALRGNDTLKVQGCAFGGMFCGGETWTRVE